MQLYVTVNLPNMANRAEPAVQAADDGSAVPMSPTIEDAPPIAALDRQKAAEYLSISMRFLDDLLSAGTIPRIKIGRKTLVRRIDLDKYLAQLAGKVSG